MGYKMNNIIEENIGKKNTSESQMKELNLVKISHLLPQNPRMQKQELDNFKSTIQQNDVTDKNIIKLTEEKLFEFLELSSQKATSACLKQFEEVQKGQLEFNKKIQLESLEFEKQKYFNDQKEKEETKITQRKNMKLITLGKIFGGILAITGVLAGWVTSLQHEKANNERAAQNYKIDLVRQDIAEKKKILEAGTEAITNLRGVYAELRLNCKYGHPYSQEKQDAMRQVAWQRIANVFATIPYAFNEAVFNKGRELVLFDEHIPDVCSYKGNPDDRLLQFKTEFFNLAYKSITEDQKKIEKLK